MFWHYVDDIFVVYQRHGDSASSKPWSTGTPWLLAFPRLSFIFPCEQLILLCVLLWDWDGAVCLHVSYFVSLHVWTAISSPDLIKASGVCWDTRRIRAFTFTSHGFITDRCSRHRCCSPMQKVLKKGVFFYKYLKSPCSQNCDFLLFPSADLFELHCAEWLIYVQHLTIKVLSENLTLRRMWHQK